MSPPMPHDSDKGKIEATEIGQLPAVKPAVQSEWPLALDLSHHLSVESRSREKSLLKLSTSYLTGDSELLSLAAGLPSVSLFPIEKIAVSAPTPKPATAAGRSEGVWRGDGLLSDLNQLLMEKDGKAKGYTNYDLSNALQYEQGTGAKDLLKFVKEHTKIVHNPKYSDWDCILTGGNTHAMETVFRMILNPGQGFIVEQYGFPETFEALRSLQIKLFGVEVDDEGMRADSLRELLSTWDVEVRGLERPRAIYLVPTGQNPTGATMSLERRKAIYEVAVEQDLLIVEDDPYYFLQMSEYVPGSDFQTVNVPKLNSEFLQTLVPSMLSIDTQGRVIRLDSFSKVIAPGMRCGWITSSARFIERILRHNEVGLQFPSGMSTAVLHSILQNSWGQEGYLDWLVNLRAEYTSRRNALLCAMDTYLPKEFCHWVVPSAGMFVWIKVDHTKHPHHHRGISAIEVELFHASIANKVLILPGAWFKVAEADATGVYFRATFASVSPENMMTAIKRFGEVLNCAFR
ncbi:pyridoxal phosphate-dependent transferase [Lipomyces arxii]|uniref:pyridoxal phosphate-dependent transferase n=1 Tax=Lipomyces arxii TaxID=56418 RepID=UPI0034CD7164